MTKGDEAAVAGPDFPQELGKSKSRRPGDDGQQQEENVGDKTLNDVLSVQNSPEKPRKRRKKKKSKHQRSEENTGESSAAVPANAPADIASMVAKAAAALEKRNESDQSPVVEDAQERAADPEKKKRRKKGHRQTSQEEESAQALLALNKSGLGGNGNDEQHEAGPTKKRKKRKAKKHLDEEQVMEEASGNEAGFAGEAVVQDAEMPIAATEVNPGKTGVSSSTAPDVVKTITTSPENDLPDSERIITEHLAAHMAKITPAQTASEDMLVEQRLINELHHNGIRAPIMGSENFVSVNPNGCESTTRPSPKTSSKKRKRSAENSSTTTNSTLTQQGLLVDPQLMQLDEEAAMAASELPADESNSKQSKKRRRAAPAVPTMEVVQEGEEDGGLATKKPAARRKTVTDIKGNWGSTASGSTEPSNGGTFTLEERFAIDRALQDYCRIQEMTMDELRDRVWGNNRRKDEFWDNICEAVPNRSRASVYKHVRRSCHIFQQRAKWTSEEDGQLAILVKEKGNKWKDIGLAMGRMGEDCRDRYRNYVKCGEDRGKDRWKEEEEELLKKAVAEHKAIARQVLLSEGKPLPSLEDEDNVLINWTTVSEKMENKRSRIQCRYKWKKMLAQKEKVKQAPLGVAYVGGKKKRLHFDVGNMLAGDKYWLLLQFVLLPISVLQHSTHIFHRIRNSGATQENEIPWDQIAKNDKEVGIWYALLTSLH
jgi:Myb-like DNA-binding protein REB1